MYIHAGVKKQSKEVGWAGDWCLVCRSVQRFRIESVRQSIHVYGLPVTAGKLLGYLRECEACGAISPVKLEEFRPVARMEAMSHDPIDLVERTNATAWMQIEERLELEQRILEDDLDPSERYELLMEPFMEMNTAVQRQQENPKWDRVALGRLLLGIALTSGVIVLSSQSVGMRPRRRRGAPWLSITIILVSMLVMLSGIVRYASAWRRFWRSKAEPAVARSLVALQPTLEELETVARALKQMKVKPIAKLVKPARLKTLIDQSTEASRR